VAGAMQDITRSIVTVFFFSFASTNKTPCGRRKKKRTLSIVAGLIHLPLCQDLFVNCSFCIFSSEEAGELIQTLLENEDQSRTASEMADLLYHAMVLLRVKDVKMEEVLEVLRKRFSQSGIEEKASRNKS